LSQAEVTAETYQLTHGILSHSSKAQLLADSGKEVKQQLAVDWA